MVAALHAQSIGPHVDLIHNAPSTLTVYSSEAIEQSKQAKQYEKDRARRIKEEAKNFSGGKESAKAASDEQGADEESDASSEGSFM